MAKRPPLDEIREILLGEGARSRKAEQLAHHIRRAANYHRVGIYDVAESEQADGFRDDDRALGERCASAIVSLWDE